MEQRLRQSLRFPPKNQPIALLKTALPQTPLGLRSEKPKPRPLARFDPERFKGIPKSHITFLPIIHARPAERLFIQRKSQRADEMQTRPDRQAKPRNIPRIRRNLRLDENDIQRGIHRLTEDLTTEDIECTEENQGWRNQFFLQSLCSLCPLWSIIFFCVLFHMEHSTDSCEERPANFCG